MTFAPRQVLHSPARFTPSTRRTDRTAQVRPKHLSLAVSLAIASLAASNAVLAQEAQAQKQEQIETHGKGTQVKVGGTRASPQSTSRSRSAARAIMIVPPIAARMTMRCPRIPPSIIAFATIRVFAG